MFHERGAEAAGSHEETRRIAAISPSCRSCCVRLDTGLAVALVSSIAAKMPLEADCAELMLFSSDLESSSNRHIVDAGFDSPNDAFPEKSAFVGEKAKPPVLSMADGFTFDRAA